MSDAKSGLTSGIIRIQLFYDLGGQKKNLETWSFGPISASSGPKSAFKMSEIRRNKPTARLPFSIASQLFLSLFGFSLLKN